ncbi:MAG: ABC transporter permease [Candidatus Acidiferrales bacterium]
MSEKRSTTSRIFRSLLRLFPFEFRGDYGDEMEQVFTAQRGDAEKRGRVGVLRLWWQTLTGIFTTAPREHWEMLRQDSDYALRMMRNNPAFTTVAVLTLGLGIGANTAIFSIVNGALLSPLPYRDGQRLVAVKQAAPGLGIANLNFSEKELIDYRSQSQTLQSLVEHHTMTFTLLGGEEPQRVQTGVVTYNFFDVFGVRPLLGRTFIESDDQPGAEGALMLSYEYWQRAFGGDRTVVGRKLEMNNRPHAVVGVLPPFPQYPSENDVYMPVSACPFRSSQRSRENRNARFSSGFARLKDGATLEQARSDLAVIADRFRKDYPDIYRPNANFGNAITPLKEELVEQARPTFFVLLGAVGFVLLIACANVANLMLSRALRRERELAMRAALGANPSRLFRQLLTESLVLSLAGGAIGLLLAWFGMDALVEFAARFTPRAREISLDAPVLVFTLGVALLTGLLFGTLPGLAAARNVSAGLHTETRATGSRGRQRARSVLVALQVAIAFTLLIGAGLMLRSFVKLQQVNPGFNPDNVLTARITLNFTKYSGENRREYWHTLVRKLEAAPGVVACSTALFVPLDQQPPFLRSMQIEGRASDNPDLQPRVTFRVVSPAYFQALGIPLLRGRTFTEMDGAEAPSVVLVSQALAEQHFGKDDPVGHRVSGDNGQTWATIVGVVGDIKQFALDREATPQVYAPFAQSGNASHIVVRTAGDPLAMERTLREIVRSIDPQPVDQVRTLEQIQYESVASPRLTTILLGVFAAVALIITVAGISGVMALSVGQRTHEIGIRMALGATPGQVLRMVLGHGMARVAVGLALGAVGAFWLTGMMQRLLFAVQPTDPVTFAAVAALLAGVAALACYIPARRAATIDPMIALRAE